MKDINLLPEEIKESEYVQPKRSDGFSLKLLLGVIVGVAIIAVTVAAPYAYIWQKEQELESIKQEIESEKYTEVKKVNKELDEIIDLLGSKTDVVDTIDSTVYSVGEIIVALQNAIPEGATITTMRYNKDRIDVVGIANDRIAIAELVASINRISLLNISSEVRVEDPNVFRFTVSVGRGGM